jgi:hypothetical protein
VESNEARRALDSLHLLREKLRKEILKYQAGGDVAIIAEINRLMADHPMRTRLIATEDGFKTEAYCDAREPDDLLGPVAYSVAALFADLDRRKIRKFSNCVLHFFDTSKKGTRRSCSSAYPLTPHGSQETGNLDHHKNGHGPHAIRWPAAISESPETAAGSAARKSSRCETARRFGLRKHCVGSQRHGLGSDSMPNSGTTR